MTLILHAQPQAKKAIADAEAVTSAATEYKAKWDAQAAELVDTRGELKGTQTELADMKVRCCPFETETPILTCLR